MNLFVSFFLIGGPKNDNMFIGPVALVLAARLLFCVKDLDNNG